MDKKVIKNYKKAILIVVAIVIAICYYSFIEQHPQKGWGYFPKYRVVNNDTTYLNIKDGELPKIKDSSSFIRSELGRYAFNYSSTHGSAEWVAYRLTRSDLIGEKVKRSTKFRPDSTVLARGWHSATDADYYRSSYNRGHLVPSSDRIKSKEENAATFSYANVAPQHARLNSGVWLMVESKVKEWAYAYNEIFIVAGAIVEDDFKYIGKNRIAIPTHFYKCVALKYDGEWYGVGFIIPNETNISDDYTRYRMSINKVEKIIKKDLFPNIEKFAGGKFEKRVSTSTFK